MVEFYVTIVGLFLVITVGAVASGLPRPVRGQGVREWSGAVNTWLESKPSQFSGMVIATWLLTALLPFLWLHERIA